MRKAATVLLGTLLVLGAAAFIAPGISTAVPPAPCEGDGNVLVFYVVDEIDPTQVVAVMVAGIAEDCGTGLVRVSLLGNDEPLASASSEHDGSGSTQRIDLGEPVNASLVDEVQVVLGGAGKS